MRLTCQALKHLINERQGKMIFSGYLIHLPEGKKKVQEAIALVFLSYFKFGPHQYSWTLFNKSQDLLKARSICTLFFLFRLFAFYYQYRSHQYRFVFIFTLNQSKSKLNICINFVYDFIILSVFYIYIFFLFS